MSKYSDRVNRIYDHLKNTYDNPKYLTKAVIDLYLECSKSGDFSVIYKTNLYIKNSSLYVRLVKAAYDIE